MLSGRLAICLYTLLDFSFFILHDSGVQASPSTMRLITSLYNSALKIMDKKSIRSHYCQILKRQDLLCFEKCTHQCASRLALDISKFGLSVFYIKIC